MLWCRGMLDATVTLAPPLPSRIDPNFYRSSYFCKNLIRPATIRLAISILVRGGGQYRFGESLSASPFPPPPPSLPSGTRCRATVGKVVFWPTISCRLKISTLWGNGLSDRALIAEDVVICVSIPSEFLREIRQRFCDARILNQI